MQPDNRHTWRAGSANFTGCEAAAHYLFRIGRARRYGVPTAIWICWL